MPGIRLRRLACLIGVLLATALSLPVATADPPTTDAPPAAESPASAPAQSGVDFFDPSRHMHLSEVRVGMKGYGLSVFSGTTRERFDVEVLSILRDFNPKGDVVLIRCHGADLEH